MENKDKSVALLQLEAKKQIIEEKLQLIKENEMAATMEAPAVAPSQDNSESIFDAKPGEIVIFNFQDVTIKAQRQLDDLFKITDASESKKLKEGDYVKIQGNDLLSVGKKLKFAILRQALNYESNPLQSWKVIKNR